MMKYGFAVNNMLKRHEFENYLIESLGLTGRYIKKLQLTIEAGCLPTIIIEESILEAKGCVIRRFEFSEKDATESDVFQDLL